MYRHQSLVACGASDRSARVSRVRVEPAVGVQSHEVEHRRCPQHPVKRILVAIELVGELECGARTLGEPVSDAELCQGAEDQCLSEPGRVLEDCNVRRHHSVRCPLQRTPSSNRCAHRYAGHHPLPGSVWRTDPVGLRDAEGSSAQRGRGHPRPLPSDQTSPTAS